MVSSNNSIKGAFERANITPPWISFTFDLSEIILRYPPKLFPRKTMLYNCNEYAPFVYVISSGRVENYSLDSDGHKKVTMICERGTFLGDISAIDGRPNYTGALLITDSMLSCIPKQDFIPLILSIKNLSILVLQMMAQKIRLLNSQIELSWFKDSESKISYVLLSACHEYELVRDECYLVPMQLTHDDIANITGLNRVTVSRVLSEFTKEGIIIKIPGKLYWMNIKRLQEKIKFLYS
ncbi:MAG: Crp/Fnr family transcriptional regulator [Peptococcaceae bacterium]